jgi:uroporphyrin-III C-methyltransferase
MAVDKGKVYLVGAGPGPAELLTLRAHELLRQAEVLLYDRLILPEVLALAPQDCQRLDVGLAPGQDPQARQDHILALMVDGARSGRRVVRLKGGDPFIFGRGGEEWLQLRQQGIDCEVIPGISSALAAPLLAGIPLTFRGLSHSFAVFTSRAGKGLAPPDLSAAAQVDCAVFLMGVEQLPHIRQTLLLAGKPAHTPLAVVERAGWPDMKCHFTTLGQARDLIGLLQPPATIVLGQVVEALHSSTRTQECRTAP